MGLHGAGFGGRSAKHSSAVIAANETYDKLCLLWPTFTQVLSQQYGIIRVVHSMRQAR